MRLSSVIMIVGLVMAAASCSGRVDKEKEVLASLLGREIVIPDSLVCRILDTPIDYDMSNADYTIITYIDSAGCTPCRMKLQLWDSVIDDLTGQTDADLAYLMIVNTENSKEIGVNLQQYDFRHPVMLDKDNLFMQANGLPAEEAYHTLLLDLNNRIVAVGNPVVNPKVREVYRRIISGDNAVEERPSLSDRHAEALGTVNAGDTITRRFDLRNTTGSLMTIQEMVPSCDCISATISQMALPPDSTSIVTVTLVADTIPGRLSRYVDIFYNETDNPERLTLHGYLINNP
ncbi:MAG: DUF1573 domain-containing protein [Paramuribaculum sp.]|nr:DUF1573 domain-containing protein [Paramuribaculum sp.]